MSDKDKSHEELEASIERFKARFRRSSKKAPGNPENKDMEALIVIFRWVGLGLLCIWLLAGIVIIKPAQEGVVLRFGKYIKTLTEGPHWVPRLIDRVFVLDTQQAQTYYYESEMLTKDENIVVVSVATHYRLANPNHYLFKTVEPIRSLQEATASALRQVIGETVLSDILTKGREQIRAEIEASLKETLSLYQTGLNILDVTLQSARAPEAVKEAFDDVIKAREDEQRFISQAEAVKRRLNERAIGEAQKWINQATGYEKSVILNAKAGIQHYLALLPEYQRAKDVTRTRLYLEHLTDIFKRTPKILLDSAQQDVLYLPIAPPPKTLGTQAQAPEVNLSSTPEVNNTPVSSPEQHALTHEQIDRFDYSRIAQNDKESSHG